MRKNVIISLVVAIAVIGLAFVLDENHRGPLEDDPIG